MSCGFYFEMKLNILPAREKLTISRKPQLLISSFSYKPSRDLRCHRKHPNRFLSACHFYISNFCRTKLSENPTTAGPDTVYTTLDSRFNLPLPWPFPASSPCSFKKHNF